VSEEQKKTVVQLLYENEILQKVYSQLMFRYRGAGYMSADELRSVVAEMDRVNGAGAVTVVLTPEQARWLDLHLQGEFKSADISGLSDRQNPLLLEVGTVLQDAIEAARVASQS
jgi:hypothetical protein